ncbi:MAG: tetratricopeptide repeat protein [Acidobacteriota bacterium]|nr:tetratricopeptide repeat protein [Acidobacteriota bacterium]
MFSDRRAQLRAIAISSALVIAGTALYAQQEDPVAAPPTPQPPTQTQQTTSSENKLAIQPVAAFSPTPEQLGDSMMARKRYQAAIEAYKKAHPSATTWNKLGIAYQMMFNLNDAEESYKNSLKLDPNNSVVLNNLGTVYDSQKKYKQAEKLYRKALKSDPHSALVLKNLGTELFTRHKYEKGWEAYKAALAADPTIFSSAGRPKVENPATIKERGAMNYYMAKGCVRAGFNDRAIEYLRKALNEGFANPRMIRDDHEFAALHGNPIFEQLLSEQKSP